MAETPNRAQVVVEDIGTLMHVRQPVYDTYRQKIGAVKQFDLTAGYMQVHRRELEPEMFYVPFHLIASIDPRHIYLKVSEYALIAEYTLLPTSQAVLTQWKDWRTGRAETAVGHRMQSGYSGEDVVAFEQTYGMLGGQLKAGMRICDIEGTNLGTVHQFDSRQGWILAVKSGLGADVLVVPFSAVAGVDTTVSTVNLLVPKESLQGDLAAILPAPATPPVGESSNLQADA